MLSLKGIIFVGLLAAMPPQEQDYQEAANALYNLDFSIAERGFETLTRESPDNPDYWNALASTIYLRVIHDQEKMNMESFTQQDKFGTRASREGVDLKDEKRLRDLLTTAMEKSKAILKNKPNDVRALYAWETPMRRSRHLKQQLNDRSFQRWVPRKNRGDCTSRY